MFKLYIKRYFIQFVGGKENFASNSPRTYKLYTVFGTQRTVSDSEELINDLFVINTQFWRFHPKPEKL